MKKVLLQVVRILLPVVSLALSLIKGSYQMPVKETEEAGAILYKISTNYVDPLVFDTGNWFPMLCVLLLVATVVVAIICVFKETENTLVALAACASFSMIAGLGSLLFAVDLTVYGWIIASLQLGLTVIAAWQEIKLEDARKKI